MHLSPSTIWSTSPSNPAIQKIEKTHGLSATQLSTAIYCSRDNWNKPTSQYFLFFCKQHIMLVRHNNNCHSLYYELALGSSSMEELGFVFGIEIILSNFCILLSYLSFLFNLWWEITYGRMKRRVLDIFED